jgi:hypothetical protein
MRNIWNNAQNLKTDRGLYCVWTAIHEGEGTRLVARWVDPRADEREKAENEEFCVQEETGGRPLGVGLRAA